MSWYYIEGILIQSCYTLLIVLGLSILTGYTGMFSFGPQATKLMPSLFAKPIPAEPEMLNAALENSGCFSIISESITALFSAIFE